MIMSTNPTLSMGLQLPARQSLRMIVVTFVAIGCLLVLPISTAFWLAAPSLVRRVQIRHNSKFRPETVHLSSASRTALPIDFWHGPKYNVSLLIIDHYDSFTYNLFDYFSQLLVVPPTVITKDAFDEFRPEDWSHIDGIILSPGPGTPYEQPLLSHQAITRNPHLPILGVCLGHQLLAINYGATVDKAPNPIHGQDHLITLESHATISSNSLIFQGLPEAFRAVRYHSLAVYDLPQSLQVTARSLDDGVVQALQHSKNPHFGVQFHPESIGTECGMAIVENFCLVVQKHKKKENQGVRRTRLSSREDNSVPGVVAKSLKAASAFAEPRFRVVVHPFQTPTVKPEDMFHALYRDSPHCMWLDSSSSSLERGTLDILAAPSFPHDLFEYQYDQVSHGGTDILTQLEDSLFGVDSGRHINETRRSAAIEVALALELSGPITFQLDNGMEDLLPFAYRGGFLGYLGYEVRYDTVRHLHHAKKDASFRNPGATGRQSSASIKSGTPTAAFFLARNSLVFHHPTDKWYMVSLLEKEEEPSDAFLWMQATKSRIAQLTKVDEAPYPCLSAERDTLQLKPNRPRNMYLKDIARCHKLICEGQSYELCLTNQLEAWVPENRSTWDLYRILRRRNPAPYSAFFRWQQKNSSARHPMELSICCSSPERFMSVKRQKLHPENPMVLQAEAKPIKGTEARVIPEDGVRLNDAETREDERRARTLELSTKNRAENLMIVDLLRNDMSRVCQIGSVHVPKLMAIESFQTVHQMVSTIRGILSEVEGSNYSPRSPTYFDLLRASFPGGSMTGAPKFRTMELLEELERGVERGPYSGSLGYLSVNGCMDMNIIIRSAVVIKGSGAQRVCIGAGGAITVLSKSNDEYEEMLLKTRAVAEAVQIWHGGSS